MVMSRFLVAASGCALLLAEVSTAVAGGKIFAQGQSCSIINCGAEKFRGSVETNANGNVDPFVVQTFSSGFECLRFEVTNQGDDLEAVLVSPSGQIWKDDDGGGSLRPRIAADTDVRGWYTLIVSRFNGSSTNTDFKARLGRYPLGNVNCASPTPPAPIIETDNATKLESVSPGTKNGPNAAP